MLQCPFLTYKTLAKYFKNNFIPLKGCLLLFGFIFLFGVANAGSIDVHKVKGNAENNTLPVEYALLGTDYAVTDFVTYANSASEVPPVIRKYSSYFGIVYTMGRIGGSLYSSAKLATAEEAAFAESAAKASTSEITTEETATATTVTSTEEKVTATSTEETAPTTPAKETTASEGTTTGTTTKENVPVETKTTEINDGSVVGGAGKLVRQATQADIDAVASLRIKYNAGKGKNIAFSKGKIGDDIIDLESVSGAITPQNALQKGNFLPPESPYYKGVLGYVNHTEQKIVEYLRVKYLNNKEIIGNIEIVSERPYCDNCIDIVDQFQAEFKNIKITRVEVIPKE